MLHIFYPLIFLCNVWFVLRTCPVRTLFNCFFFMALLIWFLGSMLACLRSLDHFLRVGFNVFGKRKETKFWSQHVVYATIRCIWLWLNSWTFMEVSALCGAKHMAFSCLCLFVLFRRISYALNSLNSFSSFQLILSVFFFYKLLFMLSYFALQFCLSRWMIKLMVGHWLEDMFVQIGQGSLDGSPVLLLRFFHDCCYPIQPNNQMHTFEVCA